MLAEREREYYFVQILICVNILTIIVLLLLLYHFITITFSNNYPKIQFLKKNSLFSVVKRVRFDYTCARWIHKTSKLEAPKVGFSFVMLPPSMGYYLALHIYRCMWVPLKEV